MPRGREVGVLLYALNDNKRFGLGNEKTVSLLRSIPYFYGRNVSFLQFCYIYIMPGLENFPLRAPNFVIPCQKKKKLGSSRLKVL